LKKPEKPTKMGYMTTKEVAEMLGVSWITLRVWCKKNNINRVLGKQGIMEYDLTKKDIENFKRRPKKGRPKTVNIE